MYGHFSILSIHFCLDTTWLFGYNMVVHLLFPFVIVFKILDIVCKLFITITKGNSKCTMS